MKKSLIVMFGVIFVTIGNLFAQLVADMDDIQFWVGTGSNRSALVIDFHYGGNQSATQQSWVWGYRWDGTATGEDMLTAISMADINLTVDTPSFIQDLFYLAGTNLYAQSADYVNDFSWGYYIAGGQSVIYDQNPPYGPVGNFDAPNGGLNLPSSAQWSISTSGSADRSLSDGSWDAWSFGAYDPNTYDHTVPPSDTAYAAIPEPSSGVFLFVASALLLRRVRRYAC